VFPFLALTPPPFTYPLGPPVTGEIEITGGLLTMTPLLLFAFALPWLRLRRPQAVGALASPLLIAAAAGLFGLLFVSFEIAGSTERYETDFAGVFLLAALAAWFALSTSASSRRRKAVRILGAVFAVWGCLTGVAISFTGYNDLLRTEHPGIWTSLENATSPISRTIAMLGGEPNLDSDFAHLIWLFVVFIVSATVLVILAIIGGSYTLKFTLNTVYKSFRVLSTRKKNE
jgi:hypothetical protein